MDNPQPRGFEVGKDFLLRVDDYLLVDSTKIADMRKKLDLMKGDSLSVYLGHYMPTVTKINPSGTRTKHDGFYLENIRFCIFDSMKGY